MAVLTLTVACGSETSQTPQPETPSPFTTTGAQTPQPKTPIPFPTIDALAQPLQPYTSELLHYTMEIPVGWESGTDAFGAELFKLQPQDRLFADIQVSSVSAAPDTTADSLLNQDVQTVNGSRFKVGTIVASDAVDVVVAGHPGRSIRYTTGAPVGTEALVVIQQAVWVVIGDYAWTFRLHIYNPSSDTDTEPLFRLFGRVLATFQPG